MTEPDMDATLAAGLAEFAPEQPPYTQPDQTPTTHPSSLAQASVMEQVEVLERAVDNIIDNIANQKVDLRSEMDKRKISLSRAHHVEMLALVERQEQERADLDAEFNHKADELDALLRRAAGRPLSR